MPNPLRRVGRTFASPVRRFFNPRFEAIRNDSQASLESNRRVEHSVNQMHDLLRNEVDSSTEATKLVGSYLVDLLGAMEELETAVGAGDYLGRMASGRVEDVTGPLAGVLNHASAPEGLAAQRNLFFNPPVWVLFEPGDAVAVGVNERIVEIPYVFRALSAVPPPATVLDVGGSESTLSLSLATLGYDVTMVDPRAYPITHPRLRTVAEPVEAWAPDTRFDAIVCVSTIEHLGLGAYGLAKSDDADLRAMNRLRELARPGATLVLTTPFGVASVDALQRVYDDAGLKALLDGWDVLDLTVAERVDAMTWQVVDGTAAPHGNEPGVAMVTARLA